MENSLSVPDMEETESCKAVLEQGAKKGQRCWRPPTNNGYCGKHQTQATLNNGKKDGKQKCKRFRCTTLVEVTSQEVYCQTCIEAKKAERSGKKVCIAKVEQGKNKGDACDKLATNGDYCGKHYAANVLRIQAVQQGIRICDDGKRACKNQTEDGKLKCESCLEKNRKKEMDDYYERKECGTRCVTCAKELQGFTQGLRSETIQQCQECYAKARNIEGQRQREVRNYREDRKINMQSHYNMYIRSACARNLDFNLSLEVFDEIVYKPCHYCGHYNEKEVNGLDRINSTNGYLLENIVPCCGACNIMKNDLTLETFLEHIEKIHSHMIKKNQTVSNTVTNLETKKSYIRPSAIVKLYTTNKLATFLEVCKEDCRSPVFIQKLVDAEIKKVTEKEFRQIVKNALIAEYNSDKKTKDNVRHRIPKKELFGYLDMNKTDLFIKVFENVHGKEVGFEKDTYELSKEWPSYNADQKEVNLNKLLIKYQNIRNRK